MPPERAVYQSFGDNRLAGIEINQLGFSLEEYYRRFPALRGDRATHCHLDEVQFVPGCERFVRRVMDTEKAEIVVSGSSARMLSREVHPSLRGRGMATVIRPFSFREFLRHHGEEPAKEPRRWTAPERSLVEIRFREFFVEGGFPETQGLPPVSRVELLQGYVDTVLFRDVIERYEVSQAAALRWLLRFCLRSPAGSFSAHRLQQNLKSQGHGVSKDVVHALLGYLMDAFLFSAVSLATESEHKRNSNPRKLYPADPRFIRAFDSSGRANLGHALETAVLNELQRRNAGISYVKPEECFEVDFLARYPAGGQELLQFCADLSTPETRARELRALQTAAKEHRRATARTCWSASKKTSRKKQVLHVHDARGRTPHRHVARRGPRSVPRLTAVPRVVGRPGVARAQSRFVPRRQATSPPALQLHREYPLRVDFRVSNCKCRQAVVRLSKEFSPPLETGWM